jgi:ATP-dependent Clp protease adaptor protein ClpS
MPEAAMRAGSGFSFAGFLPFMFAAGRRVLCVASAQGRRSQQPSRAQGLRSAACCRYNGSPFASAVDTGQCDRRQIARVEMNMSMRVLMMAGKNGSRDEDEGKTGLITKTRPKTKKPSLYKVLLLNDDYTPMEFVVHVLERFFNKGREEATRIMLHVHRKGVGICGVYTYEVAETKVAQVMDFSRQHQYPLQCTMEKE